MANSPKPKRFDLFKFFQWACLPLIFLCYFGIGSIDQGRDDYNSLTPNAITAPAEQENAFFYLKDLPEISISSHNWLSKLYIFPDNLSIFDPEHQFDQTYWDKVMNDHKDDLELVTIAFSQPRAFIELDSVADLNKKQIGWVISAGRFLEMSIIVKMHQQKWSEAIKELKLMRTFALNYLKDSQTLYDWNIAIIADFSYFSSVQYALSQEDTPSEVILELIDLLELNHKPILNDAFKRAIKHDFTCFKENGPNSLPHLAPKIEKMRFDPFSYHENRTTNILAEIYHDYLSFSAKTPPEINTILESLRERIKEYEEPSAVIPNSSGKKLIAAKNYAGANIFKIHRLQIYSDLYRLKAASVLYQRENGDLPDSLDQLDSYLGGPLYDPMQAPKNPYMYSKERKLIWSVGEDFIDDDAPESSIIEDSSCDPSEIAIQL